MSHEKFLESWKIWKIKYFYDNRSEKLDEIKKFLDSDILKNIEKSLEKETFLSLGWDWLFVYVAKLAHKENKNILWINFWNLGFLVQDREVFLKENLKFIKKKYPILKAILKFEDWEEKLWYAFNEIYITRTWDANSIELEISHLWKKIKNYRWDWLMVSTPAGSTWWSRSYSWIILPHDANLNILTPIWTISPINFKSMVLCDKGRIYIKNSSKRQNSIDILVDNKRIVIDEARNFELIIERDENQVEVLIEKDNLAHFNSKVYKEQAMEFEQD